MRRRIVVAVGAAVVSGPGHAMFAPLNDADLLRSSDLIALGEWLGQTRLQTPGQATPWDLGVLRIDELWRGPEGLQLAMMQAQGPGRPVSSSTLLFQRGDRGLWLLQLLPGSLGIYQCEHPQRFVAASAGRSRIQALRAQLQVKGSTR